jgi:DNA-binding transcriptional regulator YiaG
MRYVSRRDTAENVAARIEDVRKRTPPPKGRRARKNSISKDDFAELLGVSRSRVYAWTRDKDPAYPEEPARKALARLSGGRYQPADFERPRVMATGSLELRVAALEKVVGTLERRIFGEDVARGT